MTEKLQDVWEERDFPVLVAIARQLDAEPHTKLSSAYMENATGLDAEQVTRAISALSRAGLIDTLNRGGGVLVTNVSPHAYPIVGLWPDASDATDRLLWELERRIQSAPPEERTRLQKFREGVVGVGRDVAVEILGAAVTGRLPM